MTQYINKSAVMAEIERRIKKYATIDVGDSRELDALYGAKCKALMEILSFLDTVEVKGVDLEKEVNQYFEKTWPFEEVDEDIIAFAEYFFELGLKAQKEE